MPTFLVHDDLLEACKKSGCPLCRLTYHSVRHYLNNLFYEKVNNVELRQHLRDSRGFCNRHAWMAFEPGVGDVLGGAIIYHDVFTNVLRELSNPEPPSQGGLPSLLRARRLAVGLTGRIKMIIKALKPGIRCLACIKQDEVGHMYLIELLKSVGKEEMLQALADSDGLCLPHLAQAVVKATDEDTLERLITINTEKIAQLDGELAELIRRFDYRFKPDTHGGERDAWYRALRLAVGEPTLRPDS